MGVGRGGRGATHAWHRGRGDDARLPEVAVAVPAAPAVQPRGCIYLRPATRPRTRVSSASAGDSTDNESKGEKEGCQTSGLSSRLHCCTEPDKGTFASAADVGRSFPPKTPKGSSNDKRGPLVSARSSKGPDRSPTLTLAGSVTAAQRARPKFP